MAALLLHLRLPKHLRHALHPLANAWQVELALRILTCSHHTLGIGFILPETRWLNLPETLRTIERAKLLPPEFLAPARNDYIPLPTASDAHKLALAAVTSRPLRRIRPVIAQRLALDPATQYVAEFACTEIDDGSSKHPLVVLTKFSGRSTERLTARDLIACEARRCPLPPDYCRQLCAMVDELHATFAPAAWNETVALRLAQLTAADIRTCIKPDPSKAEHRNMRKTARRISTEMSHCTPVFDW